MHKWAKHVHHSWTCQMSVCQLENQNNMKMAILFDYLYVFTIVIFCTYFVALMPKSLKPYKVIRVRFFHESSFSTPHMHRS